MLDLKGKDNQDLFQQEISKGNLIHISTGSHKFIYLAYLSGKNAGKAGLNRKVRTTRDSFQWEIPDLQYLAYLSGRLNLK